MSETQPTLVVVDIGNTRVKWGRCLDGRVAETVSLPSDDTVAWSARLAAWGQGPRRWLLTSVQPEACGALASWLTLRGEPVRVLEDWRELPLAVPLERPDWVGIDRLLDGVAVNARRRPGTPAVMIDAGSAVTVDWLDEEGAFRGGSIFPGLWLMSQSLHDYTALLPFFPVTRNDPPLPAPSTQQAVEAGVFWAVVGGIRALTEEMARRSATPPQRFLTGGDAALLAPVLGDSFELWPEMTLEGIRLTAEAKR
jgi:type III pantothenate kinase